MAVVVQLFLALQVDAWLSLTKLQTIFSQVRSARDFRDLSKKLSTSILEPCATGIMDDPSIPDVSSDLPQSRQGADVFELEHSHGMPWKSSIDPSYPHENLFYMPFWKWQMEYMKSNLKNLRAIPTKDRTQSKDLTYVDNRQKKKRMITLCFESDEYRLIRLTYLDAGTATQVFTSLWYPRTNLPVLGIDFLQFNNQTRHLTVVDMQPIQTTEEEHDMMYSFLLEPIRAAYPSLQHSMSKRFYDENQFFSKQLLLGRGSEPDYVWKELFPAYKKYVKVHHKLVQATQSSPQRTDFSAVLQRHKAYDDYSSTRDPAHGLLASLFGRDFADAFVYDVLFPLSDGVVLK